MDSLRTSTRHLPARDAGPALPPSRPIARPCRRVVFQIPPAVTSDRLSKRELDVLALLASGKTDAQIAARLAISPRTVSTHISNMLNKTGFSNRMQLVVWAFAAEVINLVAQR